MTGHPGYKRAQVATVAAVVITYNAEDTIEECLRSLRWADQVLVVDSESTDRTVELAQRLDRKSTRLNSSHLVISYAVFCLKKKKKKKRILLTAMTTQEYAIVGENVI